jgi:hypothetical protein
MRIYLEGGPFDGEVVDQDWPAIPTGLSIRGDGTLAGFKVTPPEEADLEAWIGRRLCYPPETADQRHEHYYRRTDEERDGASVYRSVEATD